MAGVGWRLERMLERGTLSSTLQAYLTGVAVTSAPWLLTTTVLVTLRMLSRQEASGGLGRIELQIMIAYAVTLVLSAPVHVVISRYVADRLYQDRLDLVAEPLRQSLSVSMVAFLGIGAVAMLINGGSIMTMVLGTLLTAIVAGQWLLLGVGGGMSAPVGVLRAFAIGAVVSVLAAVAFERAAKLGALGYMFGFTFGQAIALLLMLVRILGDLPAQEGKAPAGAISGAFREYRLLALSAFFVHAAVWIDKLCTWLVVGPRAASLLASASSLAWFAVIPTFAWMYVRIETTFYRVFRSYFSGIDAGASLDELEASAHNIRREAGRLMRGAAMLQLIVLALGELAAPYLVAALELPPEQSLAVRLALIGASLQVLTLLGTLLLYYLDLRRDACIVAVTQLLAVAIATLFATAFGAPGALGAAIGSVLPALLALWTVRRVVSSLVPDTFQSQPFGGLGERGE